MINAETGHNGGVINNFETGNDGGKRSVSGENCEAPGADGFPPGAECAECGGRCCKEHGCVLAPKDLLRALSDSTPAAALTPESAAVHEEQKDGQPEGIPGREALLALLRDKEKGLFAIEYVTTPQGRCFYIRMRHKCYTFIGVEAMGECIALSGSGCRFTMEERPRGGKMLKSSPDGRCVQHYGAGQMCADWQPYQELLAGIYQEWFARMEEDGTFDRCDEDYFAWISKVPKQVGRNG